MFESTLSLYLSVTYRVKGRSLFRKKERGIEGIKRDE